MKYYHFIVVYVFLVILDDHQCRWVIHFFIIIIVQENIFFVIGNVTFHDIITNDDNNSLTLWFAIWYKKYLVCFYNFFTIIFSELMKSRKMIPWNMILIYLFLRKVGQWAFVSNGRSKVSRISVPCLRPKKFGLFMEFGTFKTTFK